ncbi:MAG: hypothetical protein IID17_08415 [Nitrospinae bacterium]|nr:hypothetical protein [Nitrospinota bacterium]
MLNRQIFLKLYLPLSLVLLVLLVFEGSKNEASKNIDDYIQEVNEKFMLEGKHIHPGLIAEFSNWMSDGARPHTVSVDVLAANDTNEYFKDSYTVDQGRLNLNRDDGSFFDYEWLGKLKNGIHVLEIWEGGGGSGVFMALFFVKFEIGSGFNSDLPRY